MSESSVVHSTVVVERTYDAPPARVFAAWATAEAKLAWFTCDHSWVRHAYELDFRVGGRETVSGGSEGGPVHSYVATYCDIVPNQRIVSTYEMYMDEQRTSVSLATVQIEPAGKGTKLTYTEQGVFLDGADSAAAREQGTKELFDNLEKELLRWA